jgi:hypothetical protein
MVKPAMVSNYGLQAMVRRCPQRDWRSDALMKSVDAQQITYSQAARPAKAVADHSKATEPATPPTLPLLRWPTLATGHPVSDTPAAPTVPPPRPVSRR